MEDIDDRYARCLIDPPTTREWEAIASHIVGRLESVLSVPIVLTNFRIDIETHDFGFWGDIASQDVANGVLNLSWFGFIHTARYASTEDRTESPFVAAWIFCRSQSKRLLTADGKAYVYLTYELSASHAWRWIDHGWQNDEWGEFEHWK
jgi:hypothetical protein